MSAQRYEIHVCLVSQQATPNFIPALDNRFRPKEVVLLVSDDMKERAGWLETVLRQRGIRCTARRVSDPWDVARTQEEIREVLIERDGQDIALNVTGGTKPMAIAAQDVFRKAKCPIFYVHPERNEIVPLFSESPCLTIQERVKLPDYLAIHGFHELSHDTREFREAHQLLCEEWIKEVERFAAPLRRVNLLAQQAKGSLRAPLGNRDERLLELIDKLDRYGLASRHGNDLVFADEGARFFANGGWLELHVERVVSGLPPECHIQDVARSLQVKSAGGARNEIDVAVLAANRLYLIECKTRHFDGDEVHGPGAETLYKLDSLTALGGLNTRGALVSYQSLKPWDRQRAKDLHIRVIEGGQLRNLDEHLRQWLGHPAGEALPGSGAHLLA